MHVNPNILLVGNCCNTVREAFSQATTFVSRSGSAMAHVFYETSLFFAADNQKVAHALTENKALSWSQKFKMGVKVGVNDALLGLMIIYVLHYVVPSSGKAASATVEVPSTVEFMAIAVAEEVIFRGILQNCAAGSQKLATYITPNCLKNTRSFQWLVSPSARIVGIATFFGALHLTNGGGLISDKGSFIQATRIILSPVESILYETTGNLITPIASHVTNNLMFPLLANLLSRL